MLTLRGMKVIGSITLLSLSLASLLAAEPESDVVAAARLHEKVDALMKAQQAEEARDLLQEALEQNPEDTDALRKLGSIFTIILKQPEKGAPLLEKGYKLGGDKRCLQALALAQLAMKDFAGIRAYKKDYVANFEKLSGARVVGFYIAGMEKDGTLFNDLLRRTPDEDIEKDQGLSLMIARTAKALLENDK